jgi:hypothetical protein
VAAGWGWGLWEISFYSGLRNTAVGLNRAAAALRFCFIRGFAISVSAMTAFRCLDRPLKLRIEMALAAGSAEAGGSGAAERKVKQKSQVPVQTHMRRRLD